MAAVLWPYMKKVKRIIETLTWTSLKTDLTGVFIQRHIKITNQQSCDLYVSCSVI